MELAFLLSSKLWITENFHTSHRFFNLELNDIVSRNQKEKWFSYYIITAYKTYDIME